MTGIEHADGGPIMSGDPLDPVRRILDHLAAQTEPPCDPAVEVEAYWQAIHDISTYVYPEPAGMEHAIEQAARVLIAHPSIPNHKDAIRDVCPSCPDADVAGPNSPSHAAHQARALADAGLLAHKTIEKRLKEKP